MTTIIKELSKFNTNFQWFALGVLECLANTQNMEFHEYIRKIMFEKAKSVKSEELKEVCLTINKIDIDRMGH